MSLWHALVDALGRTLVFFHDLIDPLAGVNSWGWGIVMLTVLVRTVLLPLAVKQINSMRGMQQLQPEIKRIQAKYKTDRDVMRKNPEKFREQRQKQQEELMGLYKEHGVNPAAGCLPLLLQMPIFIALFQLLRSPGNVPSVAASTFEAGRFYFTELTNIASVSQPSGAWLLVALMGLSTYYSQRQMMASNPASQAMPQQKVMLYVMPLMLVVFSFQMPVGVLLYWVTTNVWTIGQQYVMFRNVEPPPAKAASGPKDAR